MAFDPMTGEPIEDSEGGFDPMTGEPLGQQKSVEPTPEQETGGFDPMTGEPLGQQAFVESAPVPEVGGFDPMTGEPLGQQKSVEPTPVQQAGGFDPMTGRPLGQQQPASVPEAGGFDPMTGEPLGQQASVEPTPVQESGGFDPMTGRPLGQHQTPPVQESGGFDPMTGEPIRNAQNNEKAKKNNLLPFIIGGVAAAVAAILVIIVVTSGLFLGKSGKVMMAAANTFKDRPQFVEAFEDIYGILCQNKYTVTFSCNVDDVKVSGEMRNGGKEKQVSLQLKEGSAKLDMTAGIDTKKVSLQAPQLSSYVFVYDYNSAITGYLEDAIGGDGIEALNSALRSIVEETDVKKLYSKILDIYKDEMKSIKFVDAKEEEFTVNDKDVVCKGYTAVITGTNMVHIADGMEKLLIDEYASMIEAAVASSVALPMGVSMGGSIDAEEIFADAFDELRDELEDMEDIEVTFYIYKNKLAGIIVEIPDEDVKAELCFQGGDYRMQNMLLKAGSERIRLEGSSDQSKEKFTLSTGSGSNKYTIGKLEYTYESGKYTIELGDMGVKIKGKLKASRSEVNLAINEISEYYYTVSPNLDLTFKKGAKMEKLDGKVFDLGKADEDDFMDLIEDIEEKIYDKGLDYLFDIF